MQGRSEKTTKKYRIVHGSDGRIVMVKLTTHNIRTETIIHNYEVIYHPSRCLIGVQLDKKDTAAEVKKSLPSNTRSFNNFDDAMQYLNSCCVAIKIPPIQQNEEDIFSDEVT